MIHPSCIRNFLAQHLTRILGSTDELALRDEDCRPQVSTKELQPGLPIKVGTTTKGFTATKGLTATTGLRVHYRKKGISLLSRLVSAHRFPLKNYNQGFPSKWALPPRGSQPPNGSLPPQGYEFTIARRAYHYSRFLINMYNRTQVSDEIRRDSFNTPC